MNERRYFRLRRGSDRRVPLLPAIQALPFEIREQVYRQLARGIRRRTNSRLFRQGGRDRDAMNTAFNHNWRSISRNRYFTRIRQRRALFSY